MSRRKRSSVEAAAGIRGRYTVHYHRDGRAYWDVVYSATEERARADFLRMAAEVGWKVTIDRIEER